MSGVAISELLKVVEEKFSRRVANTIIEHSILPSGGADTAVGTDDPRDLVQLVSNLSGETSTPIPVLPGSAIGRDERPRAALKCRSDKGFANLAHGLLGRTDLAGGAGTHSPFSLERMDRSEHLL